MSTAFFVTGTDTGVGKTYVSCQLLKYYAEKGLRAVGMKPIAAGCELINGELVNEDVRLLQGAGNVQAPLELMNPYCFDLPIAPHIAAAQQNIEISVELIRDAFIELHKQADVVIVEGAGGISVPINAHQTVADIALALALPVIVVVGIRLGCINHTLLTVQAMTAQGLQLHGWVANHLHADMPYAKENVAAISERLGMPPMFENCWQGV